MLSSKLKLHEGFLFIYRIMMKEHNLNAVKSLANGNLPASFLLCGLLLYYLLFSLIVEQSVSATQWLGQNFSDNCEQFKEMFRNPKPSGRRGPPNRGPSNKIINEDSSCFNNLQCFLLNFSFRSGEHTAGGLAASRLRGYDRPAIRARREDASFCERPLHNRVLSNVEEQEVECDLPESDDVRQLRRRSGEVSEVHVLWTQRGGAQDVRHTCGGKVIGKFQLLKGLD